MKNKFTYETRLIAGLKALGNIELSLKRTKKYTVFQRVAPHSGNADFYFVGKLGAFRCGRTLSESFSIGCPGMDSRSFNAVLEAGDKALATV